MAPWLLLRMAAGLLIGVVWLLAAAPLAAQEARHGGRTLAEWTADLTHQDGKTRRQAAAALSAFGGDAVPALTKALTGDADPEVRLGAANALARMGPAARPAVPALAGAMKDRVPFVRRGVAGALGAIGAATPDALGALMGALVDPDAAVNDNAAHSLLALGPAAAAPLAQALKDPDVGLRQMAVLTLSAGIRFGRFRPVGPDTVTALIATLGDSNPDIRDEAARALADLGPQAKDALPTLRQMAAGDPADSVRVVARRAIEKIEARP